jgi:hypothetical protein
MRWHLMIYIYLSIKELDWFRCCEWFSGRRRGFPVPCSGGPRLIAVGTALAGGPPRRSQRALLTHWAPALGAGVEPHAWEGSHHAGGW